MADAYKRAGVDIDAADDLIDRIKPLAAATRTAGVLGGIGGFGGLFSLLGRYTDPVLVSGTDGVGTKLLIAQQLGIHDTIGIDLVAMCVNDIVVTGAEPLFFLDYFATGKLDIDTAEAVIKGIADGCADAQCALLGGETAEMPGMYAPGHYDLAGFSVGAVERADLIDGTQVTPGYQLIGLPATGVHSNGFSLVRHVVEGSGLGWDHVPEGFDASLGQTLMRPTRIYVRQLLSMLRDPALGPSIGAIAHITGGGLPGNVPRVLPEGTGAVVHSERFGLPIFEWLQRTGDLSADDMLRTFNCGVGMVLAVSPGQSEALLQSHSDAVVIGEVTDTPGVRVQ